MALFHLILGIEDLQKMDQPKRQESAISSSRIVYLNIFDIYIL